MEDKVFKEKVYGPYSEAWKVIKLLQHCTEHGGDWDKWYAEFDRFCKAHPGNQFAYDLGKFLMDAAEDIKKMNGEEA